ncbi:MAG: hypothetical protein AAGI88_17310 [Pseudomonadota bacterium]
MITSFFRHAIAWALIGLASGASASMVSVESYFFQDGFVGGGSISGFFRGTDIDGDGQIYTAAIPISIFTGLPVGNELDYAEITFDGFGTTLGEQTLTYDKSVLSVLDLADPTNPFSNPFSFFAFAFNIGGSSIGDEENEGFSFSPFAPSTNYLLGNLFEDVFLTSIAGVDSSSFGSCDGIRSCAAVLELVPDSSAPDGIRTVSQNLSSSTVSVRRVPEPGTFALLFASLFCLVAWRGQVSDGIPIA